MRILLSALASGLVLGAASAAAAPPALDGLVYESPLGKLQLRESKGVVELRAVGRGECTRKGELVFRGARIEDSVTGTLTSCTRGASACGAVSGIALFLTNADRSLSGITHLAPPDGCRALVGEELRLVPIQGPKRAAPAAREGTRALAEARAREALPELKAKRWSRARDILLDAHLLDPGWGQGANLVGVTYAGAGDHATAELWYEDALRLDPRNHDAYYNLAGTYAAQGKKDLAVTYLRIAVVNGYAADTWKSDVDFRPLQGHPGFEALKRGEL